MKSEDEKFDDLLRDIDVPEALRSRLREIPDSDSAVIVEVETEHKTAGFGWVPMLALSLIHISEPTRPY